MRRRGRSPAGKVKIEWSPNFAYALGLLAADGCLSPDGRHIVFVSKDREQVENFLRALGIVNSIGKNSTGHWRAQFGDVLFYRYLLSIGFMPNKSKIIGAVSVPREYFFDFLRGSFDGDGSTYSYWDPRWKSSFMFYTVFASASMSHINWLRREISKRLGVKGHITRDREGTTMQLKYAKRTSLKLLRTMYGGGDVLCLRRKRLKIVRMLAIVGQKL
ncbi:MAG: hypothetical protein HYS26_00280 [Candidatus Kaiserbacteria bacterium]|nr:MAG: hypothetical protein HYS26_00280 [Candidatus Kaiserbacteria bacterium]